MIIITLVLVLIAVPAFGLELTPPVGDEDQPGEYVRRRVYERVKRKVLPVKDTITHNGIRRVAEENDRAERAKALRALAGIADKTDEPLVLKLIGDPVPEVRCEALRALLAISEESFLKAAGEALAKDTSPLVRQEAAVLLQKAGKGDSYLVTALDDADPGVRAAAARALGSIGGDLAVKRLPAVMKDHSPFVRAAGAWALGAARVPGGAGILVNALDDSEVIVRGAAACALGAFGADGVPILTKVLNSNDTLYVTQSALLGLANATGSAKKLVPTLEKMLSHQDMGIRTAACTACGGLRAVALASALGATLADNEDQVRRAASLALVAIGGKEASDVLAAALSHKITVIRREAAWGLGTIRYRGAIDALTKGFRDEDEDVRVISAWALGRLADTTAGPVLCGAASDTSPAVRAEIARALRRVDTPAGRELLVRLLRDSNDNVRAVAARSIGTLKHQAINPLIDTLNDYEARAHVREDAAWALGELEATEAIPHMLKLLTEKVIPSPEDPLPPTFDSPTVRIQIIKSLELLGYNRVKQVLTAENRLSDIEFTGGFFMRKFVAGVLTRLTGTTYDYRRPEPTYRALFINSITPFVMPVRPDRPGPLVFPATK